MTSNSEGKGGEGSPGSPGKPPGEVPAGPIAGPGEITSKCSIETDEEGNEFLRVPLDEFRWIICIPHTSSTRIYRTKQGLRRVVVPRMFESMVNEDWSLHLEVYHEGNLIAPISRLNVLIDRDEEGMPKIEWSVKG